MQEESAPRANGRQRIGRLVTIQMSAFAGKEKSAGKKKDQLTRGGGHERRKMLWDLDSGIQSLALPPSRAASAFSLCAPSSPLGALAALWGLQGQVLPSTTRIRESQASGVKGRTHCPNPHQDSPERKGDFFSVFLLSCRTQKSVPKLICQSIWSIDVCPSK